MKNKSTNLPGINLSFSEDIKGGDLDLLYHERCSLKKILY